MLYEKLSYEDRHRLIYNVLYARVRLSSSDGVTFRESGKRAPLYFSRVYYPFMLGFKDYLTKMGIASREYFVPSAERKKHVDKQEGFIAYITPELLGYMERVGIVLSTLQPEMMDFVDDEIFETEVYALRTWGLVWEGQVARDRRIKSIAERISEEILEAQRLVPLEEDARPEAVPNIIAVSDKDLIGEVLRVRLWGETHDGYVIKYRSGPDKGMMIEISEMCKNVLWAYKAYLRDNAGGYKKRLLDIDGGAVGTRLYRDPRPESIIPVIGKTWIDWVKDVVPGAEETVIRVMRKLAQSGTDIGITLEEDEWLKSVGIMWPGPKQMSQDWLDMMEEEGE